MAILRPSRISALVDQDEATSEGDVATWDAARASYEPRAPSTGGGGAHATTHQNGGGDEVNVGGLSGLLADAQTPLSHSHASEIAAAVTTHEGAANPHGVYQLSAQKGAASGYAGLGADGIVPAAQLPPAGGGSDPWTKVILASDFSTTATSNTAVTGLNFAPAASKRYLVQAYLLLRTATATVGPRPGFAWPGGTTDGGAYMQAPNSATAFAFRSWGAMATQNSLSTGVPTTVNSHLATGEAVFITGASPTGTFGVTLASETSGTTVRVMAGSFLLYREI